MSATPRPSRADLVANALVERLGIECDSACLPQVGQLGCRLPVELHPGCRCRYRPECCSQEWLCSHPRPQFLRRLLDALVWRDVRNAGLAGRGPRHELAELA